MAHADGIKGFLALLKYGYREKNYHMSLNNPRRYINEFAGHHNLWNKAAISQLVGTAVGLVGKRFTQNTLTKTEP